MISVVVAVKNQIEYIEQCLNSLAAQNYSDYEVIFVDGKSTDGTREFLDKQIQNKQNFILLDNNLEDAASGRNMGIHKAKGEIIAFIDADAFADQDWLKNISSSFNQITDEAIIGVGGPNLPPQDQTDKANVITKVLSSPFGSGGSLNPSMQHKNPNKTKIVKHIPTCNLSIKKGMLNKGFLFDPRFKKGHDFELSMRLAKSGHRFLYNPLIKVWHYRKKSLRSLAKQIFKWGVGRALLIKKQGVNFTYLLPLFMLGTLLGICVLSLYLPALLFVVLVILALYILIISIESVKASLNNTRLFPYAFTAFLVIHFAYTAGLIKGLLKKL